MSLPSASFRNPKIDYIAKTMRKQQKQCENITNYNYFLRFSKKIFPDFWPQATLNPKK